MSQFSPSEDTGALTAAPLVCTLEVSGIPPRGDVPGRDLLQEVEAVASAFDLTWVESREGNSRPGWSIQDAGVEEGVKSRTYWIQLDVSSSICNGGRVPLRAVFLCLDHARKRLLSQETGRWERIAAICPPLNSGSMSSDGQLSALMRSPGEGGTSEETPISLSLQGDFDTKKILESFSSQIAPKWGRDLLSGFLKVRSGEAEWRFPGGRWKAFNSSHCSFAETSGGIASGDINLAAWLLALLEATSTYDATATGTHRVIELVRT